MAQISTEIELELLGKYFCIFKLLFLYIKSNRNNETYIRNLNMLMMVNDE